jgi:hypothetical protein
MAAIASMKTVLVVCLSMLAVLFTSSLAPQVLAQEQHVLSITIWTKPLTQPLSFGIYDTLFPVNISILIRNLSTDDFPGGNVTGTIAPPSGSNRYYFPLHYFVPKLAPGDSRLYEYGFKPPEPGVYTVHFDAISTRLYYNPSWTVSDGSLVVNVEPPSTLIELWSVLIALTASFLSVLVAIVLPAYRERKRSRKLDRKRQVAAYRLLRGILAEIETRSPVTSAFVFAEELERIDQVLATYHDVLHDTTLEAWDAKRISQTPLVSPRTYSMDIGAFAADVIARYDSVRVAHR